MKFLLGALIAITIVLGATALFVYLGWYNVAASAPHWKITTWFLEEVRERSVSHYSKGIQAPSLKDPKWIKAGFNEYHAMCQLCHGAPGSSLSELAKGLNPKPPDLALQEVQRRSNAELHWVVKNGIKMTGMPAFGPTHDEEELWSMVSFVRRLPGLHKNEYEVMIKEAGRHKEEGHPHGAMKH